MSNSTDGDDLNGGALGLVAGGLLVLGLGAVYIYYGSIAIYAVLALNAAATAVCAICFVRARKNGSVTEPMHSIDPVLTTIYGIATVVLILGIERPSGERQQFLSTVPFNEIFNTFSRDELFRLGFRAFGIFVFAACAVFISWRTWHQSKARGRLPGLGGESGAGIAIAWIGGLAALGVAFAFSHDRIITPL